MSDKVIRCGYKVGGGASRDQGFEKSFAKGGNVKADADAEPVKRDMGGQMGNPKNVPQPQQQMQQPQQNQRPVQAPQRPQLNNVPPVNMSYGLKKGGKANAKAAVKQMMAAKPARPSAALIESITIMPKGKSKAPECKEEGGVVEKAIGGAAKIRQGTFGLKSKPPIKR